MVKVCKGCRSAISPHARVCPTCGRPQIRLISKVAIAALAAAVLFALAYTVPEYLEDDLTVAMPDSAAEQR